MLAAIAFLGPAPSGRFTAAAEPNRCDLKGERLESEEAQIKELIEVVEQSQNRCVQRVHMEMTVIVARKAATAEKTENGCWIGGDRATKYPKQSLPFIPFSCLDNPSF